LDQLSKDTETLKTSEQARTERLDTALTEVESVINDLKTASRRREEESRQISDEVRGLKDLIPRAMEGQKESTDNRLKELTTELKSLKTLMGQRMNPTISSTTTPYGRAQSGLSTPTSTPTTTLALNGTSSSEGVIPKPASVTNGAVTESIASLQGRTSPFNTGVPLRAASIPSWQMAAVNKSTTSVDRMASESTETTPGS